VVSSHRRQRKAEKRMDQSRGIMNDGNYDAGCTFVSLMVWELENFKREIFMAASVR
jgi:hypothetical protein